ncbi:hypothetical protein Bpfe_004801, partial [Biomphalaria pfeifferi]
MSNGLSGSFLNTMKMATQVSAVHPYDIQESGYVRPRRSSLCPRLLGNSLRTI